MLGIQEHLFTNQKVRSSLKLGARPPQGLFDGGAGLVHVASAYSVNLLMHRVL